MAPLPDEVVRSLVKGVGAFMRQTPVNELPRSLRALRNFTDKALASRSDQVLAALEEEALRARILDWLDDKPGLPRADVKTLKIAAGRDGDWKEALEAGAKPRGTAPRKQPDPTTLRARVQDYKERAETARAELRRVRQEARAETERQRREHGELAGEISDLKDELKRARAELATVRRTIKTLEDRVAREQRRARSQIDRAGARQESLKAQIKKLKAENTKLRRRSGSSQATRQKRTVRRAPTGGPPRTRPRLEAPKGLLEDARETLEHWLSQADVILVVDGYNVTKHESGFGDVPLATQRDRLIAELQRLSARYSRVSIVAVFDGSEVPPGTARRKRGRVKVEYSLPDETADDHIVARLEELPPVPVVVATSDRELQARAGALQATPATSPQLLEVLRKA